MALLLVLAGCLVPGVEEADRRLGEPLRSALATHLPATDHAEVVVLVTLDGVRHQEVFSGVNPELAERAGMPTSAVVPAERLMPNLHWLVATRGAALGAQGTAGMRASGPNFISLPGYVELLTGDRESGCVTNGCPRVERSTLADDLAARGDHVAVFASWPSLARAVTRDPSGPVVVSAGRAQGSHTERITGDPVLAALLAAGDQAAPAPGYDGYRPDEHTAALALRYLRTRHPHFLYLGLGDTDEHGHHGDYAAYLAALRRADEVVGQIAVHLAALRAAGTRTLLVVTTDHGRADHFADHGARWPESSRVWMVAAGSSVQARGRIASPDGRFLADVNATLRRVAGLPAAGSGRLLSELFVAPARRFATR